MPEQPPCPPSDRRSYVALNLSFRKINYYIYLDVGTPTNQIVCENVAGNFASMWRDIEVGLLSAGRNNKLLTRRTISF